MNKEALKSTKCRILVTKNRILFNKPKNVSSGTVIEYCAVLAYTVFQKTANTFDEETKKEKKVES